MKKLKEIIIFVCILLIYYTLTTFVHSALYPIHFVSQNIFFLNLIDITVNMSYGLLFVFGAGNLLLLWLISKRLFVGNFSFIPPLIYAISPWGSYLVAAGSFYIYLSFLLLLIFYSLLLIKSGYKSLGLILGVSSTIVALYSSLLLLVILPVIFVLLIIFKITSFTNLKFFFAPLIVLILPLIFFISSNKLGLQNTLNNEIELFQDPGLLNMVNSYQGDARQQNFGQMARLSENRYILSGEYMLLKFIKQLLPSTLFTSQEKLLNFSFSPPIYLGFLVPFIYGLYQILKLSSFRKMLLLSTLLVMPSVLAKQPVNLNRLIIFAPVVILVISYGSMFLYARKNKVALSFLIVALFLVIFQSLVTFSDIKTREKDRFIKYFDQNYEIGKQ